MPSSAATPPGPSGSRHRRRLRRLVATGTATARRSRLATDKPRAFTTGASNSIPRPCPPPSFQATHRATMSQTQQSGSGGAGRARVDHATPTGDVSNGDYLRIGSCPCCGAPAASARPSVASSPPAETLRPDQHGEFLSGYTDKRVFFTYFECPKCSAKFCPTYYRQSQLDGLY